MIHDSVAAPDLHISFSAAQDDLRAGVREIVRRECQPHYVRQADEEQRAPVEAFSALGRAGWLGLGIPAEYGGQGGDYVDIAIALEEIGRAMLDLSLWVFRAITYGGLAVLDAGSEEQKSYFLPKVARGELSTCLALTEPNTGSDAAALTTRADLAGDEVLINGQKMFCSGLAVSQYVLLAARTDSTADKHAGISLFLIPTDTPGLTYAPIPVLGHRSVATTSVFLSDVRVPISCLLGPLNGGWTLLGRYLEWERLCLSAARIGAAQAAFGDALAWAKERYQFGKPIGSFQAVAHKLARMWIALTTAQLLLYQYASNLTQGTASRTEAAALKVVASEAYEGIATDGMQIMGGYGYSMESSMQRHFRDARLGTIGGGTSEIQLNIIAKQLGL